MMTDAAIAGIWRLAEEGQLDPDSVTPGVLGFFVTVVFALAVILLGWDLMRRLRRARYRDEIQQELAAEMAEAEGAAAPEGASAPADGDEAATPRS